MVRDEAGDPQGRRGHRTSEPGTEHAQPPPAGSEPGGFLPSEPTRRGAESAFARVIATVGVVGIGTALGAILVANDVAGWVTGLVTSAVSVALAGILWRSRTL